MIGRIFDLIDRLAGRWLDWRTDRACKANPDVQELGIKRVEFGDDGYKIVMHAPALVMLADEASALLEANNAKNYVEFDMLTRPDRGARAIRVTVQWALGEAPATKADRLAAEVERLKAEIEAREFAL